VARRKKLTAAVPFTPDEEAEIRRRVRESFTGRAPNTAEYVDRGYALWKKNPGEYNRIADAVRAQVRDAIRNWC
jgi:hypothetical protein